MKIQRKLTNKLTNKVDLWPDAFYLMLILKNKEKVAVVTKNGKELMGNVLEMKFIR